MQLSRTSLTIGFLIVFRLINSFTVTTYFQPDEFYQALEPAFNHVYKYGFVTWEWKFRIRGALIPLMYAQMFRLADRLGLDILVLPRIFHGLCAAAVDYFTLRLAQISGESSDTAYYALLASITSVNQWFSSTRSFSNNLESLFGLIALSLWPMSSRTWTFKGYTLALAFAQLAICLRPTNAVLWLFLGCRLLLQCIQSKKYLNLAVISLLAGLTFGLIQFAEAEINKSFFGERVWPLWSFVQLNLGKDKVSHFYGVMPWHFYVTAAAPVLLMGQLPFVIYGIYKKGLSSVLVQILLFCTVIYSLMAHKELRFLYFLMPLAHVLVGIALVAAPSSRKLFKYVTLVQLPIAIILTHVNQRGVIDITNWLRTDPEASSIRNITFLMPCHSTPWRSHIRRPDLNAYFLTCEPAVTVDAEDRFNYSDEASQFYAEPNQWLKLHPDRLTEHIVLFEDLVPALEPTLQQYKVRKRFFNSYLHDDPRRRGDVILYVKAKDVEDL